MSKVRHKAKVNKNDDFYTSIEIIEDELKHYSSEFKDKIILCNCDDPRVSNFFHYFSYNFDKLNLKKLITTCYKSQILEMFTDSKSDKAIFLEYEGGKNHSQIPIIEDIDIKNLNGDGDFRSDECIELLNQADIVCTNPPFSLFREYINQLIKYKKKFLILGSINAIFYTKIFKMIMENKIWIGYNFNITAEFQLPINYKKWNRIENGIKYGIVPGICWFTNLKNNKRNEEIILVKKYYGNEQNYPKYDNVDAIEVGFVRDIPEDYYGNMGVPLTFLDKYNPNQFEILGSIDKPLIKGNEKYLRFLIRRKIDSANNFDKLNLK